MQLPSNRPSTKGTFHGQSHQAARQSGDCSSSGPLNSSSKPLNQQLPGLRRGAEGSGGARGGGRREGRPGEEPATKERGAEESFLVSRCCQHSGRDVGARQGALILPNLLKSGGTVLPQVTGGPLCGSFGGWKLEPPWPRGSLHPSRLRPALQSVPWTPFPWKQGASPAHQRWGDVLSVSLSRSPHKEQFCQASGLLVLKQLETSQECPCSFFLFSVFFVFFLFFLSFMFIFEREKECK